MRLSCPKKARRGYGTDLADTALGTGRSGWKTVWRRYLLGLLGSLGFSKGGAHGKWRQVEAGREVGKAMT